MGYIYHNMTFCPYHPASTPKNNLLIYWGFVVIGKMGQFITIWIFLLYILAITRAEGFIVDEQGTQHSPPPICREERQRRESVCISVDVSRTDQTALPPRLQRGEGKRGVPLTEAVTVCSEGVSSILSSAYELPSLYKYSCIQKHEVACLSS